MSVTEVPSTICRLSWEIGKASHTGDWRSIEDRSMLEDWTRSLNCEYGVGTHWVDTSIRMSELSTIQEDFSRRLGVAKAKYGLN